MAFAVRIEGMKFPSTSPMLYLEPAWWDTDILEKDSRFKKIEETPGYWDIQAELTIAEFKKLSDKFKKNLTEGVFACVRDGEIHSPEQAMMDAAIEYLNDETDHFLVTVFEWSSGY